MLNGIQININNNGMHNKARSYAKHIKYYPKYIYTGIKNVCRNKFTSAVKITSLHCNIKLPTRPVSQIIPVSHK